MSKKEPTKFDYKFTENDLQDILSGKTSLSVYSFTKKNDASEFENFSKLLPNSYYAARKEELELLEVVYSGSTPAPYLLTIIAGRNDRFKGAEKFDIDVFNIAPESGSADNYFLNQWHHFKNEDGARVSYDIAPYTITGSTERKDLTYATFLTGSTCYFSIEEYNKEKPDFLNLHIKSFGDLNK